MNDKTAGLHHHRLSEFGVGLLFGIGLILSGMTDPGKVIGFLDLFEDIVISGVVRLVKPDPRIYHLALDRFSVRAEEAVFIDDMPANVAAAESVGLTAIRFTGAAELTRRLATLGLLP